MLSTLLLNQCGEDRTKTLGLTGYIVLFVVTYTVIPPGDSNVKGIVTAHFCISDPPPALVGLKERSSFSRDDKIQDHGGSSGYCGLQREQNSQRSRPDLMKRLFT